jgi:hypothetical protein
MVLQKDVEAALGAGRSQRVAERAGYRHGAPTLQCAQDAELAGQGARDSASGRESAGSVLC